MSPAVGAGRRAGAAPEGPAARREEGAPSPVTMWMDVQGTPLREVYTTERQMPPAVTYRGHLEKKMSNSWKRSSFQGPVLGTGTAWPKAHTAEHE